MENELHQWKELVGSRRAQFYELNYFNTMQLLTLRRELDRITSTKVSPDILALLHSISTEITPAIVTDALHHATQTVPTPPLELKDSDEEMNSESPLIERPVSDDKLSETSKPKKNNHLPTIAEEDLSEEQREIIANIAQRLYCSSQLVLMGIEKNGKDFDRYDLEKWCSSNLDLLDKNEEESSDEESYGYQSSDSDDSEQENQQFKYSTSMCLKYLVKR